MSLLLPDSGLLFWMVIIFVLVFIVLAKWGFPVITGMVDKRNDHIRESLRLAQEAQERMEKLAEEQQRLIDETHQEQGRILKEAAEARDAIISQARAQASEETAKMIGNAKLQIAAEKESALRDIRTQVAVMSVKVAEKIVRKELSESPEQGALIDKLLDETSSINVNN